MSDCSVLPRAGIETGITNVQPLAFVPSGAVDKGVMRRLGCSPIGIRMRSKSLICVPGRNWPGALS